MKKTTFHISKMDCPSEEKMIRMKLEGLDYHNLEFDIPNRNLNVYHTGDISRISESLAELKLGSDLISSSEVTGYVSVADEKREKKMLWTVLLINLAFFLAELFTGIWSRSMGLMADSLDMLADTIVYALSLFAVGTVLQKKKRVAAISGYFQIALAVMGLAEVVRRFTGIEAAPHFQTMIIVSVLALAANAVCLYLLRQSGSEEAHMKASMIFTSNDVIVNLGVIGAGVMVYFTHSKYPDLIIGSIVFILVARGALRILRLAK